MIDSLRFKSGNKFGAFALVAGNHNDLYEIEKTVSKIIATLIDALIAVESLFMNADVGFDSKNLRAICKQSEIFPNIDLNKRNTKSLDQNDYLFDPNYIKNVL